MMSEFLRGFCAVVNIQTLGGMVGFLVVAAVWLVPIVVFATFMSRRS